MILSGFLNDFHKILFLLTFYSILLFSQQTNLKFDHLPSDQELSQNTVLAIAQDKYGFLWFGTQDGLNRYDGYNFKIFTHESGNKNSLSNNYVWSIHEDKGGIMWIGSFGGGLTKLNPATETFTHFKYDEQNKNSISSNDIFGIVENPEGTLWLRTGNGLSKFDKKSGKVLRYLNTPTINKKNIYIGALAVQKEFVWAGVDSALVRLNINTGEAKYFSSYPENSKLKFGYINKLLLKDNFLFVCCNTGLIKIDLKNNTALQIPIPTVIDNKKLSLNHLLIEDNYYLIGTTNGLIIYDINKKSYSHYLHHSDKPNTLLHNNVVSIFKSREGVIWIGTYNGINKINKLKEDFFLLQYDPSDKNSLSQKNVGPVMEDSKGLIWIGTPNGLNVYNRKTNQNIIFKNISRQNSSISSNYILSIYEDQKGNIWIGTRDAGLNKVNYKNNFKVKNNSFEKIKREDILFGSLRVQSILEDSYGSIWIGTGGIGLISYNPENNKSKHYPLIPNGKGPSHSFIYSMLEDSKGNLWIGTATGGLNLLNRKSEEFLYIKHNEDNPGSLSNNIVLSIFEDSKKQLWVGTSGGLNKLISPVDFNKLKDSSGILSFIQYGKSHGLSNDVIYGILEDGAGFLWLSTNKGLIKFDPKKGIAVKVFNEKDGLQNNEFNQNSFFKNKKGEMYFGGISGLNIFHPDSLITNKYVPPVCFTDFKLFNESVQLKNHMDRNNYSLDSSIYIKEFIELSYDQNIMTFEFSSLNYLIPEKNQYSYFMEGFDNDWINAGTRRSVTYTNLDPGEYTFRVRGSNNDDVWNMRGAAIRIFISPPPWLSWYAYLFYAGIFFVIVFLFIRFRINKAIAEIETQARIEKAKTEERELVRKKSSADFHDEAGNKLTKINLFTELAKAETEKNKSLREYLNKIEENAKELSSGMRDFIWVLDPAKDSLYDTISRLKDFGNSMFDYTDIRFHVKGLSIEMKNIILSVDGKRALMLIFKEAMNNCLKYSKAKNVEMNIKTENKSFEITLKDDGKGFNPQEKSNGYGLNNMKQRATRINCNIDIITKVNEGTKIVMKGNIPQMGD